MATQNRRSGRHTRNIELKARDALRGIDRIARDLKLGEATVLGRLREINYQLVVENNPDMWALVGIYFDLVRGNTPANNADAYTAYFQESRGEIFRLLNLAIESEKAHPTEARKVEARIVLLDPDGTESGPVETFSGPLCTIEMVAEGLVDQSPWAESYRLDEVSDPFDLIDLGEGQR